MFRITSRTGSRPELRILCLQKLFHAFATAATIMAWCDPSTWIVKPRASRQSALTSHSPSCFALGELSKDEWTKISREEGFGSSFQYRCKLDPTACRPST
ncbi:unnamed protein product [Prorocentrum cordatum]|uniref:Secreted protein n=1 Tax=Prorocentrum cordatum TaxID=2364126 RepID=A0ABN9SH96_9DINO|nr:unnamed protein product [Polarella glacialis]